MISICRGSNPAAHPPWIPAPPAQSPVRGFGRRDGPPDTGRHPRAPAAGKPAGVFFRGRLQRSERRCAAKRFITISTSAIVSEGIRLAIIAAVTRRPFSPSIILIASRTKSIFHWGKVGLRGAFIVASTEIMRASMALNRDMRPQQRNGRPSFWDRPSRAPPDPKGRCCVNSRPAGGRGCQRPAALHRTPTSLPPAGRAVASHHEGEWRLTPPRSKEGPAPLHAASGSLLGEMSHDCF